MTGQPAGGMNKWVTTALGIGVAIAVSIGVRFFMSGGPPTIDAMDREIASSRTGAVMKQRFPEEYKATLDKMMALATDKALNDQQRKQMAAESTAAIRIKNAPLALKAPTASLVAILNSQVDLLKTVQEKRGDTVCGAFADGGVMALNGDTGGLDDKADAAGHATMTAIADGRDHPVERAPESEDDFNAMFAALSTKGIDDAALDTLFNGTPDPNDCNNMISMLETVISLPGESGDRVRAVMVRGILAAT